MPSAAEQLELIDNRVYRALYAPPPPGNPTRPAEPVFGAGPEPVCQPDEPPVDWSLGSPGGAYQPPAQIARGMFQWLLPGRLPVNGASAIPPEQVAQLLQGAFPSDAELLALWTYVRAVALVDPGVRLRAEQVRKALRVTEAFDAECALALQPVLRHAHCDPMRLLADVPQPVADAVVNVVARALRGARQPCRVLTGLVSVAYQHPADRAILKGLMSVPVLGPLVSWCADFSKRSGETALFGGNLEVTPTALPSLASVYAEACRVLCVERPPRLFLAYEGGLTAETFGVDEPYIRLGAIAASMFDPAEQLFLLGRELGHVQANHVKYRTLARWLHKTANTAATVTVGLANLLSDITIRPMLAAWYRRTTYTADRAGLLACQDREVALRVLMKQAGFPMRLYPEMKTRALIEQAIRYRAARGGSLMARLWDFGGKVEASQPWVVDRAAELLDWIEDGRYQEIVDATAAQRQAMAGWLADDPQMQALADAVLWQVRDWAASRFGGTRASVGMALRKMVYDQVSPEGTPVEPILRVELVMTKHSANRVTYSADVLFSEAGRPMRANVEVPFEQTRDKMPNELRGEFIRYGGNKLVRRLYRVGS